MKGDLQLHPKLGVNPHLTVCPRCGKDSNELLLIGARDWISRCDDCGLNLIGGGPCPEHPRAHTTRVRMIGEHERLPATTLCDECKAEVTLHRQVVSEGGIYFKCKCGATGVIKASAPLAGLVRERMQIAAPAPCGVELDDCPQCKPEAPEEG